MSNKEVEQPGISEIDGVPLFDDRPIDFSGVGQNIDGIPMEQVLYGPSCIATMMLLLHVHVAWDVIQKCGNLPTYSYKKV